MTDIIVRLSEWRVVSPTSGSPTKEIDLGSDARVREFARRLSATQMLEVQELREGLSVQSTSFVGRVRLGRVEITIIPKLAAETLLALLRHAYGLRDLHLLPSTGHAAQTLGFQDILVWQLIEEARELRARGLRRAYSRRIEALASPRGRIDFQALANAGSIADATIPCTHHRRDLDRLINQVLLSGLRLAASLASDRRLRLKATTLADLLEESITPTRLDREVFQRLTDEMDRMTRQYEPAISLIRLLYDANGLSLRDGRTGPEMSGFLFDMNRFFQTLMEKFLSDNLEDCTVRSELRLTGMFNYLPGWNPRHAQAPTPRPDFVVSRAGKPSAILDAKYRDLWENPLPRDMLYQLSVYAMSHDEKSAAILYPTTHEQATESRIEIRHPLTGERRAVVALRPVHLEKLRRLITARTSAAAMRDRREYAFDLAFGAGLSY